jgi:hypothetical protein
MLATIDKAQAAEQAAIMGGDRGLSGRERRMVMAQVLGGALGGTAGEMGNAAGLGMMVGGVTGGAVAGVLMLTAVIRQMGEESKHTAEIRKAASADTVEAAEWWRKDVQPQTSTIGQKHRDEAVAWGAKASAAQAAWREMAGEHPLNPGAWIEGLHSLEGQFNFAKREQRRHGAYDKADQRTFDRRQAEDRAASVRKTQLEAAGEGDDAQRGRLEEAQAVERTALERRQRDRQEEIDRKLKEDLATARAPRKGRKQRNTDFLVEKAESDYEAATKLARRETIDENSQQSGREPQERARLEREIADSKAARETEANQAEIRVSSEGFEQRRLLMEEQHRAEMATYERHGLDKKDLIRKQGAETAVLLQDEWKHQAEEAARARELFEELAKQRALAGAGLDAHSQHVAALAIERREFEKKIEKETEHTRSKSKAYLIKALNDFDDTHKAIDEHAARLEGQRITEENHPLIQFQKYKEELDRIKGVKGALGESDYIRALTGKAKSLIGDSGVGNFEDWAQRHNILQSGSMSTNEMTKKILDELQELKKIMAQLLADGFKLKAS